MIKAVIFDVDDTLYSYQEAHKKAFEALLTYADEELLMSREDFLKLHRETERSLREYMGNVAAMHNRCIRYQTILESRGLPLYPHVLRMYDCYWETLLKAAVPTEGAGDVMSQLKKRGVRIGIGTDMTARIQFKKLEVLGLLPYIDFLVSSEEAGAEKPEEAFFARCMEKAGCKRAECLFIGDSLKKDVLGAMDAGLNAVWYCPDGSGESEQVQKIPHMAQLPEVVWSL